MGRIVGKLFAVVAVFAILDFAAFAVTALVLGGDAINGKIEAGHFFLGSHGHYTEVSEHVFTYSKWHAYSVFAAYALTFFGGLVLKLRETFHLEDR
ncbi:MAG TPA: hypothetical protein VFF43_12940 [Caldimonas sp.]|nr:hypothetical protein [Caldimonas sp.]